MFQLFVDIPCRVVFALGITIKLSPLIRDNNGADKAIAKRYGFKAQCCGRSQKILRSGPLGAMSVTWLRPFQYQLNARYSVCYLPTKQIAHHLHSLHESYLVHASCFCLSASARHAQLALWTWQTE